MKVLRNDQVLVITGKDRGKTGKVVSVFPEIGKIAVSGVGLIKKHIKKSQKFPQGGRVELPGKINASNVMIICPNCKKTTRIGYQLSKNEKSRVCKKCNKAFPARSKA